MALTGLPQICKMQNSPDERRQEETQQGVEWNLSMPAGRFTESSG